MTPEKLDKITDWATALHGLGLVFDKFDSNSADEWSTAHWSIAHIINDYSGQIFEAASKMIDDCRNTFFHLNKEALSSRLEMLRSADPGRWRSEEINGLAEKISVTCESLEEARSFLKEISSELDELKKEQKKAA